MITITATIAPMTAPFPSVLGFALAALSLAALSLAALASALTLSAAALI